MSEIRKNWNSQNGNGTSGITDESLASKLEALCAAYNDIQDRLYEIDKSWKNNVVLFGIPCAETNAMEEDPFVTEDKVICKKHTILLQCNIIRPRQQSSRMQLISFLPPPEAITH